MSGLRVGPIGAQTYTQAGAGAVEREAQDRLRERISVKDYGADGDGVSDDTDAIQNVLDFALGISLVTGQHTCVYVPTGLYKITATLQVWSHVRLIGEGSDTFSAGAGGSEIKWFGAADGGSSKCAVITATDDDSDWSKGGIEHIRITNSTATANDVIGLKCRNPQNGSYVKHVGINGFPGGQFLSYEPSGRTGGVLGATPGVFYVHELYCTGGIIPVDIQTAAEPTDYFMVTAGTDATSTCGVRIKKSPQAQAQRSTISIRSSYVEHGSGAGDIPSWLWEDDLPITFLNCHTHHNGTSTNEAAWKYTHANRSLPTAVFINCTSWKMAKIFNLATAGITKAPAVLATPESFSVDFSDRSPNFAIQFANGSINASLSSAVLNVLGVAGLGNAGFTIPFRCVLIGMSVANSTAVTAGSVDYVVLDRSGAFLKDVLLSVGEASENADYTTGTQITSSFIYEAGDRVRMQITTPAGYTPVGAGGMAALFFKRIP